MNSQYLSRIPLKKVQSVKKILSVKKDTGYLKPLPKSAKVQFTRILIDSFIIYLLTSLFTSLTFHSFIIENFDLPLFGTSTDVPSK